MEVEDLKGNFAPTFLFLLLSFKVLSCTLLWCCLFFNFLQFVILENLSVLDLALSGLKGLNRQGF